MQCYVVHDMYHKAPDSFHFVCRLAVAIAYCLLVQVLPMLMLCNIILDVNMRRGLMMVQVTI